MQVEADRSFAAAAAAGANIGEICALEKAFVCLTKRNRVNAANVVEPPPTDQATIELNDQSAG